jgi:hypothetical protein
MPEENRIGANAVEPDAGPFLAKIVSHLDPTYMGTLEVQILHEAGNDDDREGQLRTVKYLNPFYGSTNIEYVSEDSDIYDNTQKSYGMWMIPPDVGTIVVVIFIGGDTRKGYWIGCVQNEDMNFSLPGYAATQYVSDESRNTDLEKERVPTSDYNKVIHPDTESDTTKKVKPETPLAKKIEDQGLLKDDIRGITTSSARREVPSMVFGISTPGPVDKQGKTGKVGKHEHKINNAFVSRLGGSSFVMDDGDDKFLRKTKPTDGPPEYASLEQGEDGIKDILHNELIRLRTRTGHQILLHNSEDLIYIGNSRGTAWIELTSDGKIEVYAEDSISFRTKQDFNFYADRDINLEAGRNFNTKVGGEKHTHVIGDQILIVDGNQKIHIKQDVDKTYDQNYKHLVKQDVNKVYDQNFTHYVKGNIDIKVDGGTTSSVTGDSSSTNAGNVVVSLDGDYDFNVSGHLYQTAGGDYDLNSGGHNNFTASGDSNFNSGGNHIETATKIHMNGPQASTASKASKGSQAATATEAELPKVLKLHTVIDLSGQDQWQSPTSVDSIMRRIPTPEPYPHHENLNPTNYKPEKLDRDEAGRYEDTTDDMNTPPDAWRVYSTTTDTFAKVPAANQEPPPEE